MWASLEIEDTACPNAVVAATRTNSVKRVIFMLCRSCRTTKQPAYQANRLNPSRVTGGSVCIAQDFAHLGKAGRRTFRAKSCVRSAKRRFARMPGVYGTVDGSCRFHPLFFLLAVACNLITPAR